MTILIMGYVIGIVIQVQVPSYLLESVAVHASWTSEATMQYRICGEIVRYGWFFHDTHVKDYGEESVHAWQCFSFPWFGLWVRHVTSSVAVGLRFDGSVKGTIEKYMNASISLHPAESFVVFTPCWAVQSGTWRAASVAICQTNPSRKTKQWSVLIYYITTYHVSPFKEHLSSCI